MPIDTPTLFHRPNLQYRVEQDWRHGRLRARSHPQQDDDHQTRVRCHPRVFAFVSAPIDTPLLYADSLADNRLCGVKYGSGTYTSEGITIILGC